MRNNQAPSAYSIYNNALPFYLDRVDLCQASIEGGNFASNWVANLLQHNLSVQLDASDFAIEKLRHLYIESKNQERTRGAKTFGFGFPMLVDTHENELLVAPMFIWLLSLEPAQTKVDSWIIRFGESQHILPNYRILQYLVSKYGLNWKTKAEELSFGKSINTQTLQGFCTQLAEHLQFEFRKPDSGIQTLPSLDDIGAFSQKGVIHWSGVLGLFPPQISQKSPVAELAESKFPNTPTPVAEDELRMTWLSPSPLQSTIQETVARNVITVLDGYSKQTRADAVVNLLVNALSNGKKALVVSERASVLKSTQALLAKTGLSQLHFLLDDSLNDKMPLLELLRVAADGFSRRVPHVEQDFQFKKHKFQREKNKVDKACEAVKRIVFKNYSWTETVGLFLSSQQTEGKELLSSQLNATEFNLNASEYETIKEGVLQSRILFDKVKTLSHPLSNLHEKNFQKLDVEESYRMVKEKLELNLSKAQTLQHRYILLLDVYASKLKEHYQEQFLQLRQQSQNLIEKIAGYHDSLGQGFTKSGSSGINLSWFFSSKRKKISQAQLEVAHDFTELVERYKRQPYFDFSFASCKQGENILKTEENLVAFQKALLQWNLSIDSTVQEEVSRLNNKTSNHELEFKEQVVTLENELDVFLDDLNEDNLFQKLFENKTLTLPQRLRYLESIIEQLETIQLNLRDFGPFYQWQNHWLDLSPLSQKVVRALIKVKPAKLKEAFDSWYLYQVLIKSFNHHLPLGEPLVENYSEALFALKPLVINQIIDYWQNRQIEAVKELKKKERNSFRLVFEKQGQQEAIKLPLREILNQTQAAVTSFLPIMFVTPQVAIDTLPATEGYYDLIIFEEASQLSAKYGATIAPIGKRIVVLGAGVYAGEGVSFMQLSLNNGAAVVDIDSKFEIFQNAGESGGTLFNGYDVENVEGRYDDLEGTNDIEAQHIVRLLNQVKQSPQRIYPSVGIVAFTKAQRDLIATYLLKLKQQNSAGSEKILQLERNGLGVFYLEELYGQQFDILFISCTLGQLDIEGNLSKKVMLMNSAEMVSYLEMLVRQQAQQIFLIHSLPDSSLAKFISRESEGGTWLLAHYIRFMEAAMNGNQDRIDNFLSLIGMERSKDEPQSFFADRLESSLINYFDNRRLVKHYQIEGLEIPLAVRTSKKAEPNIVIHPDGFFSKEDYTCGFWENEQRKKLKMAGKMYLPVWSGNWLKNPFNEARILASHIIKSDNRGAVNAEEEIKTDDTKVSA